MTQYIIFYHGGEQPSTPEEGQAEKAKWQAWVEGLGEAIVNPGTPMGNNKTVQPGGETADAGSDAISGFSIVEAESMETALEMAKTCPFLNMQGATLEVAQLYSMG